MMQYFNFSRLIQKYTVPFILVTTSTGNYNDVGDWEEQTIKSEKQGAIIGIDERTIYKSDGVLTSKDKELFMLESLGDIDKIQVIFDGNMFRVEANPENNPQFTGVWQYTLKWVSAFSGGDST